DQQLLQVVRPPVSQQEEGEFGIFKHEAFPEYQLRYKQPQAHLRKKKGFVQYSGFMDISETKHIFWWFFESRSDPENDPMILWIQGGPGGSSFMGMLSELGPCLVSDDGKETYINEYSWNSFANLIFIDQPVPVGFSYHDDDHQVANSVEGAEDVWTFLQLFYQQFPKYLKGGFTLAGESYGGIYVPHMVNAIYNHNVAKDGLHIPLQTVMIGNGLTDPVYQFPALTEYACHSPPYSFLNSSICAEIDAISKADVSRRLSELCYETRDQLICSTAVLKANKDPFDVRRTCPGEQDLSCYAWATSVGAYMNREDVKKELGVPKNISYGDDTNEVGQNFMLSQGESSYKNSLLLQPLISDGIRVLIYAGEWDYKCNWIGNKRWVLALPTPFQKELEEGKDKLFFVNGKPAGEVRTGGEGAGNFTYLKVFGAGHM
ncbi:alpha/beta-hydrolase, partial [Atractiella rhizophila]